jgi:hypothetical protein
MSASADEPARAEGGPSGPSAEAPRVEAAAERALAASLAEAIPGFELLDTALDLSERTHVHFLGADPRGRLVLVLVVAGDGESTPLRALDALGFLTLQGAALRRHLASPKLRAEAPARVVLLGERFSERTLERLEPLVALGVEAFELRHLASRARQSSFLLRVAGPAQPAAAPAADTRTEQAPLTRSQSNLLSEVSERLERLDERIEQRAEPRGASFFLAGQRLAQLEALGEGPLRASVNGGGPRLLRDAHEVEQFLDEAVSEYLRRQDATWLKPKG